METGFGSGLNFLTTAQAWLEFQNNNNPASLNKLNYTSIEAYPVCPRDLKDIHSSWRLDFSLSNQLIEHYPAAIVGTYRINFVSIELNLIFMPIINALDQFEPKGELLFDCLFLDGFAPSKNSSMWHPAILRRISFLCKQGSTLSSFSVASKVRHSLEKCGIPVN